MKINEWYLNEKHTKSDEDVGYLLGCYAKLLAKQWIENQKKTSKKKKKKSETKRKGIYVNKKGIKFKIIKDNVDSLILLNEKTKKEKEIKNSTFKSSYKKYIK